MNFVQSFFNALTRKERLIIVFFLVVLILTSTARAVLAVQDNSEFVPVRGGEYTEGVIGQPTLINPIISSNSIDKSLSSLVYSSLGDLSSSVVISGEGRVYTATIKEEAKWSDGEPITSDDVIFTINSIQNPEVNSPLSSNWRGVVVESVGDKKVRFSLPSSYVFFENNIDNLLVLPKHIFGTVPPSNLRLSSYNLEPISSGPYKFEDFQRRRDGFITSYHFKINEDYHGSKAYIKDIYFKFYENKERLDMAYKRRNVDGFGIVSLPEADIENLPNVVIEKANMPRYYSVFFNPKATSMLASQNFRQALDMAIDKEELATDVLKGKADVVLGPYGSEMLNIDYAGPSKEAARSIISDSKEEDEDISIELIVPDIDFIVQTANFIKSEWEDAGIDKVSIRPLKSQDFSSLVIRERNYEAVVFGHVMENKGDLFPFWHSSERFYPGLNLSLYSDSEVDTMLEDIRHTESQSERETKFRNAVNEIRSDSPASFLYSLPYTYAHSEKLKGFSFPEEGVVVPKDRFKNIEEWHVQEVRVIK